ncbi:Uncharacterized protein APZ42_009612, partial [Daphnia magna]
KMPRNHQVQEGYHQVQDGFEDFEVEGVLNRRMVRSGTGRSKVQYLLKYVGYAEAEWTDYANCGNCRSLTRKFLRNGG